jgi:ATP-dependent DNA helicase 2 subunit 1
MRTATCAHNESTATEAQIAQAGKVVRAFTRNAAFNPDFFPNAGLNHHYQVLLAVAFNDNVPEEVVDKTLPNYAQIKNVSVVQLSRY